MEIKRMCIPTILLLIILSVVLSFTCMMDSYSTKPTLSILMFHVVTDKMPQDKSLEGLYITEEMLREYCKYFVDNGYKVVSLEEAYKIYKNNEKVDNPNLIAFTFDDGYEDNYTRGFHILKEFGIKFNLNVIARYTDEKYYNYLTWDQINEMFKSGLLEVGNHSYDSHIYIDDYKGDSVPMLKALLPNETSGGRENRIITDLDKADKLISEKINKKINIMTYPYGVAPKDLKDKIAEKFNYYIELMVTPGVNRNTDDFKKLNRFTVNGNEKPEVLEIRMKIYKGLNFIFGFDKINL